MGSSQSKVPSSETNLDASNANSKLNPASEVTTSGPDSIQKSSNKLPSNHPVIGGTSSGGGCPMKKNGGGYFGWGSSKQTSQVRTNFNDATTTNATVEEKDKDSKSTSSCPVKKNVQYNVYSQPIDPKNNMPAVANQLPHPAQKEKLSTERIKSSIPKGGTNDDNWTYPSPQMFYNSLARKDKLGDTTESEIESVVALHNNMNEKTWQKVVQWESLLTSSDQSQPKLLKFMGRPSDLSPKARLKSWMGHPLPFDRHDWTVVRNDGTEVRYVIDYYFDESRANDSSNSGLPALDNMDAVQSILVDVRPAIDSAESIFGRFVKMPFARHVENSTKFETLPFLPTKELKSQVGESQQVWANIQRSVAESIGKGVSIQESKSMVLKQSDLPEDQRDAVVLPDLNISDSQAQDIAKQFAQMLSDCKKFQKIVDTCKSEEDCTQASLALTMCLAKIMCPVQQEAVEGALNADQFDPNDEKAVTQYNATFEKALENMTACVTAKSHEAAVAKQKYPDKFQGLTK